MDVSARRRYPARRCARAAFTLMEMLVVIGIISIFVGLIGFGFLRGGANSTVGLQAAQSIVVGLLTQARSQAILLGRNAAVLVNTDSSDPKRYMRYLVPVVALPAGGWEPLDQGVFLPSGCYVVPRTAPSGSWIETGSSWSALGSTALTLNVSNLTVESTTGDTWVGAGFNPRGATITNAGNIVLASGVPQAPGSTTPFVFTNPNGVRGLALTAYGLPRLLDDRSDF